MNREPMPWKGVRSRVQLDSYAVSLIANLKWLPESTDEVVIRDSGSLEDFDALKQALEKRLGYTQSELDRIQSYDASLTSVLEHFEARIESGASLIPKVQPLHSLHLSVHQGQFVMHAVFDGDVSDLIDSTINAFGPLIDLVWRHCSGYPGAQPDGHFSNEDRVRFKGWLALATVDPNVRSSFLYVRRSNFQGVGSYVGTHSG